MNTIKTKVETTYRGSVVDSTMTIIQICGTIPEEIACKLKDAKYIEPCKVRPCDIPIGVSYHFGWVKKTTHKNVSKEFDFLRGLGLQLPGKPLLPHR